MTIALLDTPFEFQDSFSASLPAEQESEASTRSRPVFKACYSFITPTSVSAPEMLCYSGPLATMLGFSDERMAAADMTRVLSGNALFKGMKPYAMCYGGHQFGHWAGQLGDGRAINLGELCGVDNKRWHLQLKGAGMTPYSRQGDGRAVLRSSIREFVCSEAMHALGVPTTRALSLVSTGDLVERDMFYDGNATMEPGAIVCRVAESFIRFGNFEIFAQRGDMASLTSLFSYTVDQHFPHLIELRDRDISQAALEMFREICDRSCALVVEWMRVGFVHGVMNTDNMSIIGDTIDYGPYGWLDNYDPLWTPNTSDSQQRRYRFANQPAIVQWNLLQLANALYPLIQDVHPLEQILEQYAPEYQRRYTSMMCHKLGVSEKSADVVSLIASLERLLAELQLDMTLFFRMLTDWLLESTPVDEDFVDRCLQLSYLPRLSGEQSQACYDWLSSYRQQRMLFLDGGIEDIRDSMAKVNPVIIPRNFLVQEAIDAASSGDTEPLHALVRAFETPYVDNVRTRAFKRKRPQWATNKAGCSMLSCSS